MIIYSAVAILLTLVYVFLFLYYLMGWSALREYLTADRKPFTHVSVIIAARNEEANIGNLIDDLLNQDFPSHLFEIIIVDDFSEDSTAEIILSFDARGVKFLRLRDFIKDRKPILSYKKKALEVGIGQSKGELILTTDADCRVDSSWLSTVVNFYEVKKCHMIVGAVLIRNEKSFTGKFQSLDQAGMTGITGATLQMNFPVMCSGANLAFRKSSFYEVGGYRGIEEKSSGDDVLLMHKICDQWKKGVLFLKNRNAAVYTSAQPSAASFMKQRMRWISKSSLYRDKRIILNLLMVYLFNVSILVSGVLSIIHPVYSGIISLQVATKMVLDFAFLFQVSNYFKLSKLMWVFLPAEILHILYIVFVGFAGNFFTVKWKGRIVK